MNENKSSPRGVLVGAASANFAGAPSAKCETRPTPQVIQQLEYLENSLHNLQESVEELRKRLDPVMMSLTPEAGAPPCSPEETLCPLAMIIRAATNQVFYLREAVQDIRNRVEI